MKRTGWDQKISKRYRLKIENGGKISKENVAFEKVWENRKFKFGVLALTSEPGKELGGWGSIGDIGGRREFTRLQK